MHQNTAKPGIFGSVKYPLFKASTRKPQFWVYIDREDFERVNRLMWRPSPSPAGVYAHAMSIYGIPAHHKPMHRFIMKAERGQIVDHINGNTLDNRKENLRIVTAQQNSQNRLRTVSPGKTSNFKGVSWNKQRQKWFAGIRADGVTHRLGFFDDEIEAALAYDAAAKIHHGEYARTNEQMGLFERSPEHRLDMVEHTTYPRQMRRDKSGLGPLRPLD